MGDSFEASKKRSDEIRADLSVNPGKYCMLTGDRPTGRLHLGHYFGTIRERVALQNAGRHLPRDHRRLPGHHRP